MTNRAEAEKLDLARRCAAKYWQTGEPSDEHAVRMILSGEWDDQAYVQAALAAIEECSERIERLEIVLPGVGVGLADGAAIAKRQILDHLKGSTHG